MSDYYATIKIQNGRIRAAMNAMNIKTVRELSEKCNTSQTTLGRILNFKESAKAKNGEWKQSVIKVCAVLVVNPYDMFPEYMDHVMPTNVIEGYVEHEQMKKLGESTQLLPYDFAAMNECRDMLRHEISTLPEREKLVLTERYFNNKTLAECGKILGIERESVRQIEAKALRMLRHPTRIRKLELLMDDGCMYNS